MKKIKLLLFVSLLCMFSQSKASHIIGGEITYSCLGGDEYLVTLIVYRDCTSATDFDIPAWMTVFTQDNELFIDSIQLFSPEINEIPVESDNPCLDAPDDVCVEQAIYTVIITLPESALGYILVYQRCCRNAGIVNIITPDDEGATYTQEIPPTSDVECNTSPVFVDFPPTVICVDDPIVFDHSAFDLDGDSLVYDFYKPYTGAIFGDPMPIVADPPPYSTITWVAGFDEFYPVDATPAFEMDSETGLLTGTAISEGRYVVGIVCKEYRDGVWLGDHIRDFQFNVELCAPAIVAQMELDGVLFADVDPDPEEPYINCLDFSVVFDNLSTGGDTYSWDFGDGTTSILENPVHLYTDTGTYYVTLIVNPGFVCADTAIGIIALYNTLTAQYDYTAGCSGTPVVFTDLSTTTEAGEIIEWEWNFADGSTSTEVSPEHEYVDGGTYSVILTVTTDKGCVSSITYDVLVEPGPDVDFLFDDVCQNVAAEFTNLSTITTGSISSYLWDFGDGITSTDEEPTHLYGSPGTFTVTLIAYSSNGCSDTLTATIDIGELPFADAGPDQTINYLETYTLNGTGVGTFSWFPLNPIVNFASISSLTIADPVIELEETTTFLLTVTSPDGCSETDTVTIFVNQYTIVEVPSAFSPNGDGINDEIFVIQHEVGELLEYTIFNRWGEIIFTTSDINIGWDGFTDGTEAEMGTYVYLVRAEGLGGEFFQRQGNITLVR